MCGCAKFQATQTTLTFPVQIFQKIDLGLAICWNKNQHCQDAMHANFQEKQTTLTFSTKICAKMGFRVAISKL